MKKIGLIGIIIFSLFAKLESQSWISSNKIASSNSFIQIASKTNNDGEVLTYGYFEGILSSSEGKSITSAGLRDYYLIKFFLDGKVDWMKNFGGSQNEYISG